MALSLLVVAGKAAWPPVELEGLLLLPPCKKAWKRPLSVIDVERVWAPQATTPLEPAEGAASPPPGCLRADFPFLRRHAGRARLRRRQLAFDVPQSGAACWRRR